LPRFSQACAAFFEQWTGLSRSIRQYWFTYGGLRSILRSPHVHVSFLLTITCIAFGIPDVRAADIALGAVPNLLGFTVGALAIVLAFSSADIFRALAEDGKPTSFFMTLTANLTHFVSVQVLALIIAALAKFTGVRLLDYIALFFLFYAVLVTFATALQLFHTARIYNANASIPDRGKPSPPP
jgi:hypothetical protein